MRCPACGRDTCNWRRWPRVEYSNQHRITDQHPERSPDRARAQRRNAAEHQHRDGNHNPAVRDEKVHRRIRRPAEHKIGREQRHAGSGDSGEVSELHQRRPQTDACRRRSPNRRSAKLKRQVRQVDAFVRVAVDPPDEFVDRDTVAEDQAQRTRCSADAATDHGQRHRDRRNDGHNPQMQRSEQSHDCCPAAKGYFSPRFDSGFASVLPNQRPPEARSELIPKLGSRPEEAADVIAIALLCTIANASEAFQVMRLGMYVDVGVL